MKRIGFTLIVMIAVLVGCNTPLQRTSDEPSVAKVGDAYLYLSAVDKAIPKGLNANDSIALARNYVNTWIKEQLILNKAKDNLNKEQLDFSEQLNKYKNSLIRYTYETELIRQKLDTIVSEQEIEVYYKEHPNNFQLMHNIIRVNFVAMGLDSLHHEKTFRELLYSDKENYKDELEEYCKKYAEDYFLEDSWVSFNDFLGHVPIKTYNKEEYLHNNKKIVYADSMAKYLIHLKDFRIKNDLSPLSFEKNNIRNIIINKRKLELIKKMESDVFDEAIKNNEFEIYY